MVQYEPLVVMIYKCIENVKTTRDNNCFIIVIVHYCHCNTGTTSVPFVLSPSA